VAHLPSTRHPRHPRPFPTFAPVGCTPGGARAMPPLHSTPTPPPAFLLVHSRRGPCHASLPLDTHAAPGHFYLYIPGGGPCHASPPAVSPLVHPFVRRVHPRLSASAVAAVTAAQVGPCEDTRATPASRAVTSTPGLSVPNHLLRPCSPSSRSFRETLWCPATPRRTPLKKA